MNNFQLNNTSVYLGGQCKWDIVLGNKNGQIYIQGFQLTPLSDNVAYNKRGSITHLNKDHSYTIKKYCNELKENFWSVEPYLNQKVEINGKLIGSVPAKGEMDNSLYAGTRRSSCFGIYDKQFECLQPVWLEKLEEGKYLKFSFNLCSISEDHTGLTMMDSKSLEFKPIDLTDKTFEFHNKFVAYFYDWLKQLNINNGNNKVLNVDLQNGVAQIDGVSTISGQKSDLVSCDYICDNLLSYERPNIETDYILTTLFKNHNIITSQLFNFCFCFNLGDVVNSFFINQLNGKTVSLICDVSVDDNPLTRKGLYTNYEFIKKHMYDPYLFIDDMPLNANGDGGLNKAYLVNYLYHGQSVDDVNVLDYLKDYNSEGIKDLNKLSQQIIHWDYIDHNEDIFNLYRGYSGLNSWLGSFDRTTTIVEGQEVPLYNVDLFELYKINCNDVVYDNSTPNPNNGILNWINPAKILKIDGPHPDPDDPDNPDADTMHFQNITTQYFDKIKNAAASDQCIIYHEGLWNISKSVFAEYLRVNPVSDADLEKLSRFRLTFIIVPDGKLIDNGSYNLDVFNTWRAVYKPPVGDNTYKAAVLEHDIKTGYDHYVIISEKIENFSIFKLLEIAGEITADTNIKQNFVDCIGLINKMIRDIDGKYNFYGFHTEIEIGKNDLENECYYKSINRKTFVYRKCGALSPCMKTDTDDSINYLYCKNTDNNSVHKINITKDNYDFEHREYGRNEILLVMNEIKYDIIKSVSDPDNVEKKIKERLNQTYHLENDQSLIDYIYNLYEITFTFEYVSETDISNVNYKVNMVLK